MNKRVEITFSDQAETIIESVSASKEQVADFLADQAGFTVGGSEVVQFLESGEE
jgi:hypothetical protein